MSTEIGQTKVDARVVAGVVGALAVGALLAFVLRRKKVRIGRIFRQGDPQWGAELLGNSTHTDLARSGCMLTSVAMATNALTGADWNPSEAQEIVRAGDGFNGSLLKLVDAARSLECYAPESERIHDYDKQSDNAMRALIESTLAKGGVPLVHIDYPSDPDIDMGNHFIVIHDESGGSWIAADPANGKNVEVNKTTLLTSKGQKVVGVAPIYRA